MLLSLKVFVFAAIGVAAANDEGPVLMKYNQATDGNRMLKSKQDKSAKVQKLPKAPKDKSKGPKMSSPPQYDMPEGEYHPELVNPAYWHPKNRNFEIIDWDKFYAQDPTVPAEIYFPQRSTSHLVYQAEPFGWWHRNLAMSPPRNASYPAWPTDSGMIDDPDLGLWKGLLEKSPYSHLIPPAFRNSVFWMEYNEASETLATFNRGAWRSNTKEGRAVGLITMDNDFTTSPNAQGYGFARSLATRHINFQVSPCGKWIKLFTIGEDPCDEEADGRWITMYIVQEGDEFFDQDGNKITDIVPGDIYRTTYEGKLDPYEAAHEKIVFIYLGRKIAVVDELSGGILINPPMYNKLVDYVTREPPQEISDKTNGFTDDSMLTREERWDLQTNYLANVQNYNPAPQPPPSELIENLDYDDASKVCMA